MTLTFDQRPNDDGFPKAGELVEVRGAYSLTLQDGRIFNRLVEHAGSRLRSDTNFRIALWQLRGERDRHKGHERVRDSLERLMRTLVIVPWKDSRGQPATLKTTLLAGTVETIDEDDPASEVSYSFSPELRLLLLKSRYWARIKASVCFNIGSRYGLRLYEAIALRINRQTTEEIFTVENFRELLGVKPGRLLSYPHLRQKAIVPAITEVNQHSPYLVEIEPVRQRGKARTAVVAYRMRWSRRRGAAGILAVTESAD
jgi:hypothetical protein